MFKNRFLIALGLLSLLLVAMAISRPLTKAPTSAELRWPPRPVIASGVDPLAIQRGREADTARLSAMGEYYQNQAANKAGLQRSRAADAARWTLMAKYYQDIEAVQRGRTADALRWTAMAEYYKQMTSASR